MGLNTYRMTQDGVGRVVLLYAPPAVMIAAVNIINQEGMNMIKSSRKRITGQGMTEYIVIVALIALAGIAVFSLFGKTVRGAVGDMASELSGTASGKTAAAAAAETNTTNAAQKSGLGNYGKEAVHE